MDIGHQCVYVVIFFSEYDASNTFAKLHEILAAKLRGRVFLGDLFMRGSSARNSSSSLIWRRFPDEQFYR